jgi:ribulose-5-phosphate 4-epimerase/fuculose-1-phosphate aldolase
MHVRRPTVPVRTVLIAVGFMLSAFSSAQAQTQPAPTRQEVIDDLVVGNHVLADLGVVDGFGHLTARDPEHPGHFLMSRSLAPALVKAEDIMEFDRDGNPVDQQGRAIFLERFIHGEVYKARPDVNAVVHTHSSNIIPFSDSTVPLRAMFHSGAFLAAGVPVFELRDKFGETDMLVRNNSIGSALATTLADKNVALIRGHGDLIVASNIPMAVFRAYYTDLNAKLEAQAISLGGAVNYLTPEEGIKADRVNVQIMPRAWDLWKRNVTAKSAPQ